MSYENLESNLKSAVVHAQGELESFPFEVNENTVADILARLGAALSRLSYIDGELRKAFPDQK